MSKKGYLCVLLMLPLAASAASSARSSYIGKLIIGVGKIINSVTVIMVGVALLVFLWGVATYIFKAGGKEAQEGKNIMIWGIGALFVIVSVWGLVNLLEQFAGVSSHVSEQQGDGSAYAPSCGTEENPCY